MKFVYELLVLVLCCFVKSSVQWDDNGALNEACSILHGNVLQTIESSYSLTATLLIDGNANVKIQAIGDQQIGGFLIQGRQVVDDNTPVGSFNTVAENYQTVACVTDADSTTHINSMSETEFDLLWIPPIGFTGDQIYFIGTVMSTFNKFWGEIISATIDFRQDTNTSNKIYQLCDRTRKCFESSAGCSVSRTCDAIAVVQNVPQFEQNVWSSMVSLKPKYIAFGISNGSSKVDISVFGCIAGQDDQINPYTSYTEITDPDSGSPHSEISKYIVNLISFLYHDDMIQCVIECDSVTTLNDQEYSLLNVKFYDQVGSHDLTLTTAEIIDYTYVIGSDPIYDNCDGSRVCFGAPLGCIDQRNCKAVTVIHYLGDKFQFELKTRVVSETQPPDFITFGISDNPSMVDLSVQGCMIGKEGKIHAYISQPKITETSRLIQSTYVDGMIHCLIECDTVSRLLNEQYYLQIAVGSELQINSISKHNLIQATSVQKESLYNALADIHSIYEDCGVTKQCFGHPRNCINTFNCLAITAVNFINNVFQFEMMADNRNGSRYVAFGLSNSTGMGNASVIECVVENDAVNVYTSYTEISPIGSPRTDIPQNIVRLMHGSYENGVIHCVVERNTISEVRGQTFDLMNDMYYLLVASGTSVRADSVAEHDRGQLISESRQSLRISTLATTSSAWIKVHGIFMIVAWLGAATIGAALKMFFNKTKPKTDETGKVVENQWFPYHRICMISTGLLTITAFIVIFVEIGGWSAEANPHAILGTTVTGICLLQILGGIFRPAPSSKHRIYFKQCHLLCGIVAEILAIMTISFATSLPKAQLPAKFTVVFGVFRTFFTIRTVLGHVNKILQHYKKEKKKKKMGMKKELLSHR